jgi:UDP-N-acetyl-D-galactosamine dehydrogenase
VSHAKVLVLGLTFKENCPDIRNTRVIDIIDELADYDIEADVYDPWVNPADAKHEYGIVSLSYLDRGYMMSSLFQSPTMNLNNLGHKYSIAW